MKTKFFLNIFFIIGIIAISMGCNNIEGPAIKFEKLEYDFGEINQGESVEFSFKFKNPGNEELTIENVRATCGCTVPGEHTKTVAPGKSGVIPVIFNSRGFQGDVIKIVKVTTNLPDSEPITLTIKGNIYVPIQVEPPNMYLGRTVIDGPELKGTTILTNRTKTPLIIEEIKVTGKKTSVEINTITEGQEYQVEITEIPPFTLGSVKETLTIRTNIEERKVIDIIYSYTGTQDIEVSPKEIIFAQDSVREGFMRIVTVISYTDVNMEVINPSLYGNNMNYTIEEFKPGQGYHIKIDFDRDFVFPENDVYHLSFQLKTDKGITSYTVPIINAKTLQE